MLPRHRPDAEREGDQGDEGHDRELDQEVAYGADGGAPLGLHVERYLENPDRLFQVERFFAADDGVNEFLAACDSLVGANENLKLARGVDHPGDDKGQHGGRRNEQQFSIEAHSYN